MKIFFVLFAWPVLLMGSTSKIRVVTSTSVFQDMIENVGGEFVEVRAIVSRGSDPHRYEPKPGDVSLCRGADIIMINGLHLEVWIEKLISNSKTNADVIIITESIEAISYRQSKDPHAWMNARNGIRYAENIARALIRFRPEFRDGIQSNLEAYKKKLERLDAYIQDRINSIPVHQRILVSNHDAFRYFGKQYGMQLVPLMGISTEAEPRTSDIIRIMQAVKTSGIKAIFVETSINPRTMEQLAHDLNISLGGSLYSDSLGEKDGPAATYAGMLRTNTETIVKALLGREKVNTEVSKDVMSKAVIYYGVFIAFLGIMTVILAGKIIS